MAPDPQLVIWIIECAHQTHANPVLMLATSMHENGAKLDCKNPTHESNGTLSYGPFQHNTGGALGNHPPSWACTKAAVCERASAFARANAQTPAQARAVQGAASGGGAYERAVAGFIGDATRVILRGPQQGGIGGRGVNPVQGGDRFLPDVSNPVSSITDLVKWLGKTHNLIRVAEIWAGVVIVTLGIIAVLEAEKVVPSIPSVGDVQGLLKKAPVVPVE